MRKLTLYFTAAVLCASAAAWAAEPATPSPRSEERVNRGPLFRSTARGRLRRGRWTKPLPISTAPCRCRAWCRWPRRLLTRRGRRSPIARAVPQKDPERDAFWYRRTFTLDGPLPAVAKLKVAKAMFGTRVFLNGTLLGDHVPSFTPGYFDAKPALKTGSNEILIRVGADRDAVGRAYPDGFDFEKQRYIPGIFDSVELILSGTPHFVTVQAAPDVAGKTVRVQAVLRNDGEAATGHRDVRCPRGEVRQGRRAARQASRSSLAKGAETTVDVRIPLDGLPAMVARRPVPLHARSRQRRGHLPHAVRHARVQVRSGDGPGDAQRQAVFHARQQHHALPLLRGQRVREVCRGTRSGCGCCTSA